MSVFFFFFCLSAIRSPSRFVRDGFGIDLMREAMSYLPDDVAFTQETTRLRRVYLLDARLLCAKRKLICADAHDF